jgi:hypothetical protein
MFVNIYIMIHIIIIMKERDRSLKFKRLRSNDNKKIHTVVDINIHKRVI